MKKAKLVYIIDDDPIHIFGTKKMMELTDFCENVSEFRNGKEAMDALKSSISKGEKTPELIMLDLNMPVMNGWDFLEQFTLLPVPPETPVYIVISSIDPGDIEMAKHYKDVKNCILKPVTIPRLKAVLDDFRS